MFEHLIVRFNCFRVLTRFVSVINLAKHKIILTRNKEIGLGEPSVETVGCLKERGNVFENESSGILSVTQGDKLVAYLMLTF